MQQETAMFTYECTVKGGHVGSGRYEERRLVVRAPSILDAFRLAKRLPGVKKGRQRFSGASVLKVVQIQ